MSWKCKNKDCGKTFEIAARLTIRENLGQDFPSSRKEKILEKACCPFCESIDFEAVKETKE